MGTHNLVFFHQCLSTSLFRSTWPLTATTHQLAIDGLGSSCKNYTRNKIGTKGTKWFLKVLLIRLCYMILGLTGPLSESSSRALTNYHLRYSCSVIRCSLDRSRRSIAVEIPGKTQRWSLIIQKKESVDSFTPKYRTRKHLSHVARSLQKTDSLPCNS